MCARRLSPCSLVNIPRNRSESFIFSDTSLTETTSSFLKCSTLQFQALAQYEVCPFSLNHIKDSEHFRF